MERLVKPRFFYGWVVVAASTLTQLHLAWPANTVGVFFSELEAEFGWGRAAVSAIIPFTALGYAIFNMLGGWLTDKYGPRLPIILGGVITAATVSFIPHTTSLGQFYALYVLAGATGFVFPIGRSIVQRWFRKRRGLALGIVMAGGSEGGFIYPILMNWIVGAYGWRSGYYVIAGMVGIMLLLVALLIVASPEKMGLKPYGAGPQSDPAPGGKRAPRPTVSEEQWTVREAVRTRAFPLLMLNSFLTVIPSLMITVHLIPFAAMMGISKGTAAAALGTRNIVGILGSIVVGGFADRLGWKRGLVVLTALGGVWTAWLMVTRNAGMLWAYVILFGFFGVGRGPLTSGLLANYYGVRFLTMLIAINNLTTTVGSSIGPLLGGVVFERSGSYFVAFLIGAILWGVAAASVLAIRPPVKRMPQPAPGVI